MLKFIFFISVFVLFYVYLGYPLAAAGLGLFLNRKVRKADRTPSVTILIAAYNECESIESTVRNKLEQDYPADRLEVIVISDGSNDGTDDIVRGISDPRLRLIRQEPRAGKTSALNLAATMSHTEIIVFSDANSLYAPDTIRHLVKNFADPTVGYVTGRMIYANPDGTRIGEGCSTYMKYENLLRKFETLLGSVVGVDGGVDAIRKSLYQPMMADQLPDFVLPLKVVAQGYRVVYEPEAMLWESTLHAAADEYRMRVRVSLRALWALFDMRELLMFKTGLRTFAWQLWSHKALRYSCFVFISAGYISNLCLLRNGGVYVIAFILQTVAVVAAIMPYMSIQPRIILKISNFANYFALLNLASAHAALKFFLGKKQALWNPRKG